MKAINANLTADVVTSYDQTKTTLIGRVTQKTIDGVSVVGPVLNKFVDVVTDTAGAVVGVLNYSTSNGRMFTIGNENAGISLISLHTYDFATGATAYVGSIRISLPDTAATTHTIRSIKVMDTGTTGWKIFVTTVGSITINGGTFVANNIALADFVPAGFPTIPFATGTDQKAVYFLQDPAAQGVGQLQIASAGSILDTTDNKIYVHNGIAAAHQYYVYNTNVSLTYTTAAVTGSQATDVITDTGHTFVDNTPVVFTSLTGGAGLVLGTVYFVRNQVPGVSYQLSGTTGGAPINFTTDITSAQIGRAFGNCSSAFSHKTGNLPALSGTLLLIDSEDYAVPGHTTNSGQPCVFFATSSNLYLGQLADLTPGAVTWPTLVTSNLLGTANQIVAPSAIQASWSNLLDRAVYVTNINIFVIKQVVNNSIEHIFGGTGNTYFEATPSITLVDPKTVTTLSLDFENGVLFILGGTIGQRGVFTLDAFADKTYASSYVISPVLDIDNGVLDAFDTVEQLYDFTGALAVEYRLSGFGSATGGWLTLPYKKDLSAIASGAQIQFRISFDMLKPGGNIGGQIHDLVLSFNPDNSISDYWEYDQNETLPATNQITYRLKKTYVGSVPNLRHTVRDLSNTLTASHTTTGDSGFFEFSSNGGVNWAPLGLIPNTVGTLLRYTNNSLPNQELRPALKEA